MIAQTYSQQKQVIDDNPNTDTVLPTDIMKMRHIKEAKLQGTTYVLAIHHDFQQCTHDNSTFDTFMSKIRATVEYIDHGAQQVAQCRARLATSDSSSDIKDALALIASTDKMYLNDAVLHLMCDIDPEFVRRFIRARDHLSKRQGSNPREAPRPLSGPTETTDKEIPRQYDTKPLATSAS
jgi:hypothetical protein